jgi:transposase
VVSTDIDDRSVLVSVIKTLQQQLEQQQVQATQQREHAERDRKEARREIARLTTMIEGLTRQLDELLRDRDEERRQELARLKEEALVLAAAALEAQKSQSPAPPPQAEDPPKRPAPKRHAHGKGLPPPQLPRDEQVLKADTCTTCGSTALADGEELPAIEEYDYVRAHLRVRRTILRGCTCEACGTVMPPPPPPPMAAERATCTFAMLAWLLFAKGALFLPLDRLCRDFSAQGTPLASSTLTRWWQRGADALLPVAACVRASLLCDTHIRRDGTGLLVVHQKRLGQTASGEEREGQTDALGYLLREEPTDGQILVFGNEEHLVYVYTPDRKGEHVLAFLTVGEDASGQPIRWRGTLTADALNAYDCVFASDERTETGCNSHGLRKFRDDADKAPLLASAAMNSIGQFFSLEAKAREQGLVDGALLAYRQQHIKPVADAFKTWLEGHRTELLPSHPVRKAMQYYLNHWEALTYFLHDAAVELTNNFSERALRKVALLRNNSLYAGGEEGAVRLCTVFTLVGTCRLLGVDAFDYLEWALSRLVPHPDNRGLVASDLTPAAYKALQQRDAG